MSLTQLSETSTTEPPSQPTLAGEQVGHRAVGAKVAVALGKGVAYIGHRAIAIVGHDFDQDCDTAGSVTLVGQLFDIVGFVIASTSRDRSIDSNDSIDSIIFWLFENF